VATSLTLDPSAAAPAPAMTTVATRDIGGVAIAVLDRAEALRVVGEAMTDGRHLKIAFCNAHLVNLVADDEGLRRRLDGFLVLADGVGVDIGARLLHGAPFPANLNGTDFTPALLGAQARPLRVALFGGRPGIADRAAARLAREFPRHRFDVTGHGFLSESDKAAMLAALAANPADLLLVALGNPVQESFISERIDARHAHVAAGIGALFDFLAGEVARAPKVVRALRLEWAWRLWLEPGRLWRRYVLGNPVFLLRMLRLKLFGRRTRP
jgi:exopolysaccharide biosynthesis WecB/TagA/CpsF family protein